MFSRKALTFWRFVVGIFLVVGLVYCSHRAMAQENAPAPETPPIVYWADQLRLWAREHSNRDLITEGYFEEMRAFAEQTGHTTFLLHGRNNRVMCKNPYADWRIVIPEEEDFFNKFTRCMENPQAEASGNLSRWHELEAMAAQYGAMVQPFMQVDYDSRGQRQETVYPQLVFGDIKTAKVPIISEIYLKAWSALKAKAGMLEFTFYDEDVTPFCPEDELKRKPDGSFVRDAFFQKWAACRANPFASAVTRGGISRLGELVGVGNALEIWVYPTVHTEYDARKKPVLGTHVLISWARQMYP